MLVGNPAGLRAAEYGGYVAARHFPLDFAPW